MKIGLTIQMDVRILKKKIFERVAPETVLFFYGSVLRCDLNLRGNL